MPGYLLDNNHVNAYFQKNPAVIRKIASLPPDTPLRASTITLGEIEAGHRITRTTNQTRRDECTAWINKHFLPNALGVSVSTRIYYAEIIDRIWKKHPPPSGKKDTEPYLVSLGVDINDVWTVAVAMEHGLIFVTQDKMQCIREVVPPPELEVECWY